MKKLFDRDETWFSVLWIAIYVIGCSVADQLSDAMGVEKSVTLVFTAVLTLVLGGFLRRHGLSRYYGLCAPTHPAGAMLFYLPLVAIATVNLWFGAQLRMPLTDTLCGVGTMLLVGFLEELLFRGLLFRAMAKSNPRVAVLVTSLLFGLGHIINLVNGSGADLLSSLCQVCYAAAIGFLFVTLLVLGGSIWPAVLTHSLLNALSVFANEAAAERYLIPVSIALCVISLGYALLLWKRLPPPRPAERSK